MSERAAGLYRIEQNNSIPSWRCEAVRRSDLKRITFWMRGSQIVTPEQVRLCAAAAFVHLDCSDKVFRCEKRENEPPPVNKKPVPLDWFIFGTDRMRAEIDAGLRPFSEYLLPAIQLPQNLRPILHPTLGRHQKPAPLLQR